MGSGTNLQYSPSGTLYIVSAPSGAGKTSLVKRLLESTDQLTVSVSHTTRAMRPGEENGVDYHFVDTNQFDQLIADDAFLEHAKVFGNHYGTSRAVVDDLLNSGTDVILEIDWQGAQQVRANARKCVGIFVLPPSRGALLERLRGRGQDSDEIIEQRMVEAVGEMAHYHEYDYLVINDDFEATVLELSNVLKAQRLRMSAAMTQNRNLIKALLDN